MNKKTLVMFLLGLVLAVPARALDFSAIDPRLADSGQNNEQTEEQPRASVRKSSVFQNLLNRGPPSRRSSRSAAVQLKSSSSSMEKSSQPKTLTTVSMLLS